METASTVVAVVAAVQVAISTTVEANPTSEEAVVAVPTVVTVAEAGGVPHTDAATHIPRTPSHRIVGHDAVIVPVVTESAVVMEIKDRATIEHGIRRRVEEGSSATVEIPRTPAERMIDAHTCVIKVVVTGGVAVVVVEHLGAIDRDVGMGCGLIRRRNRLLNAGLIHTIGLTLLGSTLGSTLLAIAIVQIRIVLGVTKAWGDKKRQQACDENRFPCCKHVSLRDGWNQILKTVCQITS
jgi:hypothetical protein